MVSVLWKRSHLLPWSATTRTIFTSPLTLLLSIPSSISTAADYSRRPHFAKHSRTTLGSSLLTGVAYFFVFPCLEGFLSRSSQAFPTACRDETLQNEWIPDTHWIRHFRNVDLRVSIIHAQHLNSAITKFTGLRCRQHRRKSFVSSCEIEPT